VNLTAESSPVQRITVGDTLVGVTLLARVARTVVRAWVRGLRE
jgi:hypothetical protein